MDKITTAQNILLICDKQDAQNALLDKLLKKTSGEVTKKLISELLDAKSVSSYDFILSGFLSNGIDHDSNLLSAILKALKPDGIVVFRHILSENNEFASQLKLAGFVNVTEVINVEQQKTENDKSLIEISCSKPKFEIGSSAKLSFAAKVEKAAVWKLDDSGDDDDEIDPDTLLDEDDLKKPDPSSLKVCGTTGKRKACKDCSCGLADELESEGKPKTTEDLPKSSCGSCYLGDAFRCASCPYIGMPAFKPGEKIQLAGNQLNSDI